MTVTSDSVSESPVTQRFLVTGHWSPSCKGEIYILLVAKADVSNWRHLPSREASEEDICYEAQTNNCLA